MRNYFKIVKATLGVTMALSLVLIGAFAPIEQKELKGVLIVIGSLGGMGVVANLQEEE